MKLVEISNFEFNRVEIAWHGPYEWTKQMSCFSAENCDVLDEPGIYRAESAGRDRRIIKYIGSASNSFRQRLNKDHRIKRELVDGQFRKVRLFLGVLEPERRLRISKTQLVEIEYILQNVHYHDLVSWHGLAKLPMTSRGQGWHIVNKGEKGPLSRVIAYPAFAVSGRDG